MGPNPESDSESRSRISEEVLSSQTVMSVNQKMTEPSNGGSKVACGKTDMPITIREGP